MASVWFSSYGIGCSDRSSEDRTTVSLSSMASDLAGINEYPSEPKTSTSIEESKIISLSSVSQQVKEETTFSLLGIKKNQCKEFLFEDYPPMNPCSSSKQLSGVYRAQVFNVADTSRIRGNGKTVSLKPNCNGEHKTPYLICVTVCDGHDGYEAAQFIIDHFPLFICHKLRDKLFDTVVSSTNQPSYVPRNNSLVGENCTALVDSIVDTFRLIDDKFQDYCTEKNSCTAGSCLVSIIMIDNIVFCAGLGDCRAGAFYFPENSLTAIASNEGFCEPTKVGQDSNLYYSWLCNMHRATVASEVVRLAKIQDNLLIGHRLMGILQPTRAIGDHDLKLKLPKDALTYVPSCTVTKLNGATLILAATDGIWDVLTPTDIAVLIEKTALRSVLESGITALSEQVSVINKRIRQILTEISTRIVLLSKSSDDDRSCVAILIDPSANTTIQVECKPRNA